MQPASCPQNQHLNNLSHFQERTMPTAQHHRPLTPLTLLLAAFLLAGCASSGQRQIAGAITSPLSDLNLIRADIPPILDAAQREPFAPPQLLPDALECDSLALSMHELDVALAPGDHSGGNLVVDQGVGRLTSEIQKTTDGLIPYRSWIRKLSGAERHAQHVASAIAAGTVRRAFLKGWAQAKECPPPAPPLTTAASTPAATEPETEAVVAPAQP